MFLFPGVPKGGMTKVALGSSGDNARSTDPFRAAVYFDPEWNFLP
jgi:hypothetical protein